MRKEVYGKQMVITDSFKEKLLSGPMAEEEDLEDENEYLNIAELQEQVCARLKVD
jgi:hypothetical protein